MLKKRKTKNTSLLKQWDNDDAHSSRLLRSVQAAARILSVSPIFVYMRIESGEWPAITLGSRRFLRQDFIEKIALEGDGSQGKQRPKTQAQTIKRGRPLKQMEVEE